MTKYRWEFGFDYGAAEAYGTLSESRAPNSPFAGQPFYLLQDGFVKKTDAGGTPAWPTQVRVGDSIEFRFFDLTSVQDPGVASGPIDTSSFQFSILNSQTGETVQIFEGAPFSPIELKSDRIQPSVWPVKHELPAWTVQATASSSEVERYLTLTSGVSYATLSLAFEVISTADNSSKIFGLDPEIWILDG